MDPTNVIEIPYNEAFYYTPSFTIDPSMDPTHVIETPFPEALYCIKINFCTKTTPFSLLITSFMYFHLTFPSNPLIKFNNYKVKD